MSHRTMGRVIGAMFLAAFLCYGIGALLAESVTSRTDLLDAVDDHRLRLALGGVLMLGNSVTAAVIGVLAYAVLRERSPLGASAYFLSRTFEAVVLAVGVIALLTLVPLAERAAETAPEEPTALAEAAFALPAFNDVAYQVGMLGLGLGAITFCATMLRHRLVPAWLANWGIVGYSVFAAGAASELLGLPIGIYLTVPGGLWEVTFGVFLLRYGFPEPVRVEPVAVAA